MQKSKVSLRLLLCVFAAVALSAFVLLGAPAVYAQTDSPVTVSDSDALAAALADESCTAIHLVSQTAYILEEPVELSRALSIAGNGAAIELIGDACISVPDGKQLSLSDVSLRSQQDYSITASGTIILGSGVTFAGDEGIILCKGAQLTTQKNALTAAEGLVSLITAAPEDGTVSLTDIRLSQVSGETILLRAQSGSGTVQLSGTVELFASNGAAVFCPSDRTGPTFSIADSCVFSAAAENAVYNQELDIPGAALDIRSCSLTIGANAAVGLSGSYCGVTANNITIGEKAVINALCSKSPSEPSFKCAAFSAGGALTCKNETSITIGSSGGNTASGLYGETAVDIDSGVSIVFRSTSSDSCAVASGGKTVLGANCSLLSRGGGFGIRCGDLAVGDKCTIEIREAASDGIHTNGKAAFGSDITVNVDAQRCAVYSTSGISFGSGGVIELASRGDGAALWINGTVADNLFISGSNISVHGNTNESAQKNAAVYVSGAVNVEKNADVTIINENAFGLIAAGGSVNVSGEATVLRCSGGVGVLVSSGSLLVSGNAALLAEGTLDSAVRIERGSFSATGGAYVDVQGVRFGIETMSGDVYIDGASFFDIRSTSDRAVFVENGRLTIINVDRLSVWDRDPDNINWYEWWKVNTEYEHSWELTQDGPGENWMYASHTALSPNLTSEHRQGVAIDTEFAFHDSAWAPADYSRLGQYISRPSGRTNSFNIPAGKSFSWMLFGSSYDNTLVYRLLSSTGDGTFDLREDGTFTYSSLDYSRGEQSFEFVVENGDGAVSVPATVTIFVTASKPPVASSATFPVNSDEPYIGQVSIVDYDGTIASVRIEDQPLHGTVIISSDGKFNYEPDFGFVGLDSFSYIAVDNLGDESSLGYITLAVGMSEQLAVCNGTIITESSTQASMRLSAIMGAETVVPAPQFVIVTPPVYGVLSVDQSEPELITYIPYEDFSGTDHFTYAAVLDDGTLSEVAHITVATVPSQRPTAVSGIFYCTKNSSCNGRLSGSDVDGTIVSFALTGQPDHGRVELDPVTGEFVYYADSGFTGDISFEFTVTDSDGLISEPVAVKIHVASLLDNLRSTGRLGAAIVLIGIIFAGIAAITALIIFTTARRRRELEEEKAKSRLFEYSGSDRDYYDYR